MSSSPATAIGGLILLVVRGILLWISVPVTTIIWVLGSPWFVPRGATLGRFLGWIDIGVVVAMQSSILRPFYAKPTVVWVPFSDIATVTHRIGIVDPY